MSGPTITRVFAAAVAGHVIGLAAVVAQTARYQRGISRLYLAEPAVDRDGYLAA